MDIFLLQAVVDELAPQVLGERLGKVFQSDETSLAIDFRLSGQRSLVVSIAADNPAIYLGRRPLNEDKSQLKALSPFAVRVRKLLGSGRLIRIEKLGDDRVIDLDFRTADESGEPVVRRLVLSLIGRSADVYLVEGNTILASMRGRDLPGTPYRLPQPVIDRIDPFELPAEAWEGIVQAQGSVERAAAKLLGFTPTYCREVDFLAKTLGAQMALRTLLDNLTERPCRPAIYSSVDLDQLDRQPGMDPVALTLASTVLHHLEQSVVRRFHSISEAAERYYALIDRRQAFIARRQAIVSRLRTQLKKQRSLQDKLVSELARCSDANHHQRLGEILMANIHQASRSGRAFLARDYFEPGEPLIEIPDRNAPDAQTAAAQYFRLARKARHGQVAISERLALVTGAIATAESNLARVMQATEPGALEGVSLTGPEQTRGGRPGRTTVGKRTKETAISGVRRYRSSDGFEILVGRTDRDNDNLTLKVARSSDLWFHAADYPGSHVVLRNPQRKIVAAGSIKEAAELAAKFSQARKDSKVAVKYCEKKFVSKPKGFSPGQVRLSSFKTILVEPKESGERIP